MCWVRNKTSQFANCKPFLENCNSKLLKNIAKHIFLTIKYFFHSELPYLLCPLVDKARKEITQINSLIFHRIAKNLVRTNTSLVTLAKNFKLLPIHHLQSNLSPTQWPNTKKELLDLPFHEIKTRSLLWQFGALLMQYSVPESGRPMKALFNTPLITSFLVPISQQFTQDRDI